MPLYMEILFLLILIFANGIFSMMETAVVSARRLRLQQKVQEGHISAQAVLNIKDAPQEFLSTVQIGITLVGILTGAFGGVTLGERLGSWLQLNYGFEQYGLQIGIIIVVIIITYLSLVLGELVPKHIALCYSELIAMAVAIPMKALSRLVTPLVWILSKSTGALVWLFGCHKIEEPPVTEEEIQILMEQGTEAGVIEESEHDLVKSIMRFTDRRVYNIMTPRSEIVWLNVDDPLEINIQKISENTFSQYPVCKGDLDKVIGIVSMKDLWRQLVTEKTINFESYAQKPLFVVEHLLAPKLQNMFRDSGSTIALVVDEYGVIKGLVTIFDMMQAIVGDTYGTDHAEELQVFQREDGSWVFDAMIPIEDFKEIMHIQKLPNEDEDDYEILAGFMLTHLEEFPQEGMSFELGGYRYEVIDMDYRRIDKVLVEKLPEDVASNTAEERPS